MSFDFDNLNRTENDFRDILSRLYETQKRLKEMLQEHADGKILKGDELVGWLGEIYTKIILRGKLVDDCHEHDVETSDGWKISVKTRCGNKNGWTRSSAIPKIEGQNCPSHLMFVHLNEDYSVQEMWLYPWSNLVQDDRFKRHNVRGRFRSFYMNVKPSKDDRYKIFSGGT